MSAEKVFAPGLLAGRVAFVAGGTSGINLAIALRMVTLGAKVHVLSRKAEKVAAAVAQLQAHGEAAGSAADVRDFDAVALAADDCAKRFGPIDIVVSGAAGNFLASAADLSPKGFRTVIDIDLIGGFHVMKATYPHLRRPGASIINLSAVQSYTAIAQQVHACAAKAGLDSMIRALALEWGPEGIRLNSIAPGPVGDTEGMARLAPSDGHRDALTKNIPLGRWASKDDIANLAVFLASDASANISGTLLVSDGGYSTGRG